jgi:hypothetical protein
MVGHRTTHELRLLFTVRDRLATLREVYRNRMLMSTVGGTTPLGRTRGPSDHLVNVALPLTEPG